MNNCKDKANKSIECTVSECKYHCAMENYCTLDTVKIGTHESHPTEKKCVDCESFVAEMNNSSCK